MATMEAVITSITDSASVRIFTLAGAAGAPLPPYMAGAHIDVTLGNGITRQYSLCCSAPSPASYRIAVKRELQSRGGSAWLHASARVGDRLTIGTPRNAFALADGAGVALLFAGGIGITPLLSMAYALHRAGRPFRLACYARSADDLAFATELAQTPFAGCVAIVTRQSPQDNAQHIAATMDSAAAHGSVAGVYTCGPAPFMDAVAALGSARFGAAAVHRESFGAAPAQDDATDQPFTLHLVRSGREIAVAAGRSALACLHDAGVDIDCSCEVGVCGTCRTTVVGGEPDHRDAVLSDAEKRANDCFLPCVSRARTPVLSLDL